MTKSTPRDPSRAALANAIADATEAERELQAANDAVVMARDKFWEAEHKLEEIRESNADEVSTANFAAAFIASVKEGAPCDVAVMEDPAKQARDKEKAAANDADVWERTYESCKSAIPVREEKSSPIKETPRCGRGRRDPECERRRPWLTGRSR